MPATSKAQQRLMGMAYSLKKGEMDPEDVSQEVKDLADSMTLKQLKKYASTKHEGLPDKIEESTMKTISKAKWKKAPKDYKTVIKDQKYMMEYDDERGTILVPVIVEDVSPANISGMGAVEFPNGEATGSGDVPAGRDDAEEEYKKKKRKAIPTFEQFVNEAVGSDKRLTWSSKNKGKLAKSGEIFEDIADKLVKLANKYFNVVSSDYPAKRPLSDGDFLKIKISGEKYSNTFNKFVGHLTSVRATWIDAKGNDNIYYFPLDKEI